jgi:hypothetical protein
VSRKHPVRELDAIVSFQYQTRHRLPPAVAKSRSVRCNDRILSELHLLIHLDILITRRREAFSLDSTKTSFAILA